MPGKSPHSPAGVGSQSGVGGESSGRAACFAGVSAPSGAGGGERLAGVPKLI